MFAIGFLSLLSVGFVAMASGGDDDDFEVVNNDDSEDEDQFPQNMGTELIPGPIQQDTFVPEQQEPEIADLDFAEDDSQADPGALPDIEDLADILSDQMDEIGEEEEPVEEETAEEDAVARPPVGDDYIDPLIEADELAAAEEAQRILDEIAAENLPEAQKLVTITDADGNEIPDESVLVEASEGSGAHLVVAPEGNNDIQIGFESDNTFEVVFNEHTSTVSVGLNSSVEGPSGTLVQNITNEVDEDGEDYQNVTMEKSFNSSTEISLVVDETDIGEHFSEIELLNPSDSLLLDFDPDLEGTLHLVFIEDEEEGTAEGESRTTKTAFVIQADPAIGSFTAEEVEELKDSLDGQFDHGEVLAVVHLGTDSVSVDSDQEEGEPYEIRIQNFMNDNPAISSNLDWVSITTYDGDGINTVQGGSGGAGGDQGDIETLDMPDFDIPLFG